MKRAAVFRQFRPPVKPSETNARAKLAADLARGDATRALVLMRLPLFRVALEGAGALA